MLRQPGAADCCLEVSGPEPGSQGSCGMPVLALEERAQGRCTGQDNLEARSDFAGRHSPLVSLCYGASRRRVLRGKPAPPPARSPRGWDDTWGEHREARCTVGLGEGKRRRWLASPDLLHEGTRSVPGPQGCRAWPGPPAPCAPGAEPSWASGTGSEEGGHPLGCGVLALGAFGVALATHEIIRSPAESGCLSNPGATGGSLHAHVRPLAAVPTGPPPPP